MSTAMKILLGIGALVLITGVSCVGSVIGTNNDCVAQEAGIRAQYKQNQNNYDNMWKKFKEVASVPQMYTDDLKKVYDSAIRNRYGTDGSKAMFQWLQEHNPQFDSSMYKQIQVVVESGRNSFEANQKMLLDKKRAYETKLGQFPTNMVVGFLGFPKIDMDKYDIVTSAETEQAFETKQTGQIKLR